MTEEEKFLVNKLKENKNSYIRLNFVQVEFLVSLIQKQSKVIDEMEEQLQNIREEFLQYDWKNSNPKQIYNQLKSLYESIYRKE